MNVYQRAAQFWAVLALAARNRQILTYQMLASFVGMPMVALGGMLDPIQTFCQKKKLPPLTVLVVQQESGLPGTGFIAAADIPRAQADVFNYNWIEFGAPNPENIQGVVEE
jgi:hypothetical protein